jgi:hypothetical protein
MQLAKNGLNRMHANVSLAMLIILFIVSMLCLCCSSLGPAASKA